MPKESKEHHRPAGPMGRNLRRSSSTPQSQSGAILEADPSSGGVHIPSGSSDTNDTTSSHLSEISASSALCFAFDNPRPDQLETKEQRKAFSEAFKAHMLDCHPPDYDKAGDIIRKNLPDGMPISFTRYPDPPMNPETGEIGKPTDQAKVLQLLIYDTPTHSLKLSGIYKRLIDQFSWYAARTKEKDKKAYKKWTDDVRNLLSSRDEFRIVIVQDSDKKTKHSEWTVNFGHGQGLAAHRGGKAKGGRKSQAATACLEEESAENPQVLHRELSTQASPFPRIGCGEGEIPPRSSMAKKGSKSKSATGLEAEYPQILHQEPSTQASPPPRISEGPHKSGLGDLVRLGVI